MANFTAISPRSGTAGSRRSGGQSVIPGMTHTTGSAGPPWTSQTGDTPSATLRFRNPVTFRTEREIEVRDDVRAIWVLNKLEFVDGSMYANIRQSDRVARIDPESGAVTGWLDLAPIVERERRAGEVDVANGLAWDGSTLYVTGKLWRSVYGLELLRF